MHFSLLFTHSLIVFSPVWVYKLKLHLLSDEKWWSLDEYYDLLMDTPVVLAAAGGNKTIMPGGAPFYERQQHFNNAPSFG